MDTVRYELKTLNRQFSLYAKTRVSLANNLIALLDQSFPGVNRWFDSPARKDGSQQRGTKNLIAFHTRFFSSFIAPQ